MYDKIHYKLKKKSKKKTCFDDYSFVISLEISNGILPYYIFFFWLFGYFGVY